MIDASSKTARNVATSMVIVAAATTMVMNAKFAWTAGSDDIERYVLMAFGISIDVVKLLGLAFIVAAFVKRHYFKACAATVVFVGAISYSLMAGIGFASHTRTTVVAERNHSNTQVEVAMNSYKTASDEFARLSKELDTMKLNKRYVSTSACSVPNNKMTEESQLFCNEMTQKLLKHDDAKKMMLQAQAALPKHHIQEADPQMKFFAELFGVSQKKMVEMFAIYFAILAEIVSSLGTFAFSSSRLKPDVRKARAENGITVDGVRLKKDGSPAKKPGRKPRLAAINGEAV